MTKKEFIDPWGSELPGDYLKIIKKFGLEKFEHSLFPNQNKLMRRGIIFAGRGLKIISKAIREKKSYYCLTGMMPSSEKIHLGNKLVIDSVVYFQNHGADSYVLIADLESLATRNVDLETANKRAVEYFIPAYIALGIDPKKTRFYFQSRNLRLISLMFELSKRATLNEYRAIYGNTQPSRIVSSILQVADILFPQLKERMPGIIPVGIDQDPHIRLSRDIAKRAKKGFSLPSSLYNKYTPALDGSLKMSKSKGNFIELPDSDKNIEKKISKALTGGRKTTEEQKKLGGELEKCMIFELYKQHLIEDDKKLEEIYKECKSGKLLCGKDKENCINLMKKFMADFKKKFEKAKIQGIKLLER